VTDQVQVMIEGVREAGADVSTVADHLEGIDYLALSEGASLTAALALIAQQVQRASARVNAIEGAGE
jgi:hypothetical protein